jgi:uncharacterized protein (DUF1778 family)
MSARPAASERKSERLELRVTPSTKATIQRAVALSGLSAGDLAFEAARRIIEDHERMYLTGADRDAVMAALRNPPEPTEYLRAAMREYRELYG